METSTSTAPPADGRVEKILKGKNFLFAILCGGFGVIFVAILFKRIVHRFTFRYTLRAHIPGHRAPKKLKKSLQNQLSEVATFCYEPYWLLDKDDARLHNSSNQVTGGGDNNSLKNRYLYRLKTIDGFRKIDECLAGINAMLSRPCDRPMLQHLMAVKSHSSGCFNFLHRSDLETLSSIYEQARYSPQDFGPAEYKQFCEILEQVLIMLQNPNEIRKRKSLYKSHRRSIAASHTTAHTIDVDPSTEVEMLSIHNPAADSLPDTCLTLTFNQSESVL